jgi:2-polyprenyl-3-methyl-5-hydroxy-6-metoxy-1,4-benzoquinol methylase
MKLPPERGDATWTRIREHDVEELWDHARAPHVAATYLARMELLRDVIAGLAPEGRVLDVGCAQGTLGLMLGERGVPVDLLDIRPENIEYARSRYERGPVGFYVGLLSDDCPPRRDYQVVVCTEVLEHVPSPSDFLAQLKRKLRPGGALCLTTPNGDYALSRLPSYGGASQRTIDGAEANSLDGDAHTYLYTREELIALVRGIGLAVERHEFFSPVWLEGHLKTRYLHAVHYQRRHKLLPFSTVLSGRLARRLCSAQLIVARSS